MLASSNTDRGDAGTQCVCGKPISLASALASAAEGPCAPRVSAGWLILIDASLARTITILDIDVPSLDPPPSRFLSHHLYAQRKCLLPIPCNNLSNRQATPFGFLLLSCLDVFKLQDFKPASKFKLRTFKPSNLRSSSHQVSSFKHVYNPHTPNSPFAFFIIANQHKISTSFVDFISQAFHVSIPCLNLKHLRQGTITFYVGVMVG